MSDEKDFNLVDAEKLLPVLELLLTQAMEGKRRISALDEMFEQVRNQIQASGGLTLSYEELAARRVEREKVVAGFKDAVLRIESHGCVIKDLDIGLIDFPSRLDDQQVYLCWKLGEEHIRFWHHRDEGFANRKPLGSGSGEKPQSSRPN